MTACSIQYDLTNIDQFCHIGGFLFSQEITTEMFSIPSKCLIFHKLFAVKTSGCATNKLNFKTLQIITGFKV